MSSDALSSEQAARGLRPPWDAAAARALARAHGAGMAAHPSIDLPFEEFARRAWDLARRRVRAAGARDADERARTAIEGCAAADLYRATACEAGVSGAWEALAADLLPR